MRMKNRTYNHTIFALFVISLLLQSCKLHKGEGDKPRKYVYPLRPEKEIKLEESPLYFELSKDSVDVDWTRLDGTLEYVRNEYDCSDFRLVNLVRILYEYGDQIPDDYHMKIKDVLLNFRYWWDEPGENSMCYWSENHQILFASAEYLIGQLHPDEIFPNSGLTGKQHMDKARIRILDWLEMRWNYGFTEYYSNVYYKEDIGALINLIDYAGEEEVVKKCQIIMDLLFYDIASQTNKSMFISVSGRAYKQHRTGIGKKDFDGLPNYLWGDGKEIGPGMMYGMMTSKKYVLPPVLGDIARDSSTVIIKQSNGLDLTELKQEGYYGTDNRSMMMQWGMEAFTNPIIIRNSLKHIRNTNMFSNAFVGDFRKLNYLLFRWFHLEPVLARMINPQTNGVAIQKGNTYTYKTGDYSMYTVQNHQVGDYADQQHVFGINMNDHFAVFHNHPAREKKSRVASPNYWVGYGRFPHSVQDKNVNLSIYKIPRIKNVTEKILMDFTKAYFPLSRFDTAFIAENYAFGKKGDTYCVFIGSDNFYFRDEARDDLVLPGKRSFWIAEAGSASDDGSFENFIARIRKNEVIFNPRNLELTYNSNGRTYELTFGGDFRIDEEVIDTEYSRYDAPYVNGKRKDLTITISHGEKSLFLDFENMIRKF